MGDIICYVGDIISNVRGIISTVEDIQLCGSIPSVIWMDIISIVKGYHQYIKGYSVVWGDTTSTAEDI